MNGVPREFFAEAIAKLNGTDRQKKVVLAYLLEKSVKQAARRTRLTYATAKCELDRIYSANGVNCLVHLFAVATWREAEASRRRGSPTLPEDLGGEAGDEGPVAER